jgi:carboxyl-terminal processing protease
MRRMIAAMVGPMLVCVPCSFAADVDDVHQMLDSIEQAWVKHDLQALAGQCHPQLLAVLSRPGTAAGAIVMNRDQVLAQIAEFWGSVASHQFLEREISIDNGIAWMQLTVADRMSDRSSHLGYVLNAAVKVGGDWKMCTTLPRFFQAVQIVEDLQAVSPAGQAGLRPGDVIVSVGAQQVRGSIGSRAPSSAPSGKQEVVVRRKTDQLRLQVNAWPGGATLSERLAPFGGGVLVGGDAGHDVKDKYLDDFRGYITGDLDRAFQAVCPAGYQSFRMADGHGAVVPVNAEEERALLQESLRATRKTYDLATMQITGVNAIVADDVAVVGGLVTASTRGANSGTVSSPSALEVWVRQGENWFVAANLPVRIRVGLDTTAKGPAVDAKALEQRVTGKMVGIGVQLGPAEPGFRINEVFPGTPAERAGMRSGDIITAVGGRTMKGLSINEAVSLITGPEGTRVTVTVQHSDGSTRTVGLIREAFRPSVISGRILKDGIGLVVIPQFYQDAPQDFRKQVETLHGQGAVNLVLDLRGCTGGVLDSVRAVAEMLVPAGRTLWIVQGEKGSVPTTARRSKQIDLPVVVLTGSNTGGAPELLASALKQNNRAIVMGRATAGLARIRTAQDRPDGRKELVDGGTFLASPNVPITGRGVQPDVEISPDTQDAEVLQRAAASLNGQAQPHPR